MANGLLEPKTDTQVKLIGADGNAFSILARVEKALKSVGYGGLAREILFLESKESWKMKKLTILFMALLFTLPAAHAVFAATPWLSSDEFGAYMEVHERQQIWGQDQETYQKRMQEVKEHVQDMQRRIHLQREEHRPVRYVPTPKCIQRSVTVFYVPHYNLYYSSGTEIWYAPDHDLTHAGGTSIWILNLGDVHYSSTLDKWRLVDVSPYAILRERHLIVRTTALKDILEKIDKRDRDK